MGAGHVVGERGAFLGQALEHARVGVAHLVKELGASGNDVGRARMHADDADVGHAHAAAAGHDVLARAQGVVGTGEKGVSPPLHRRRAGVIGLAHEDDAGPPHAHDRLDDADGDAGLLQARALLDVELDVRRDRALRRARVGCPAGVEPRMRHGVHEPGAVGGRHLVDIALEQAAKGPRAEEAAVATFLVAPRRHRQGLRVQRVRLADYLKALEARQNAERAVEHAALGDGVDVRAGEDRRRFRRQGPRAEGTEGVARRIDPRRQPGGTHFPEQPRARFLVRRRPARARHAAAGQGAEARERVDPRREPRQGDGDHKKAV